MDGIFKVIILDEITKGVNINRSGPRVESWNIPRVGHSGLS